MHVLAHFEFSAWQVLLVLDSVDALFEGQAGDAKDLVVELLDYLCRFNGQLHLLMTSETSVLKDTLRRLHNGAERVRYLHPSFPPSLPPQARHHSVVR